MVDKNILLNCNYSSEHELYYKMISTHNVVYDWGLTNKQIEIVIYIIRYGYSKETKLMICKKLDMTEGSLDTNLSYMRNGKVGNKKIKKVLKLSNRNMNITELCNELKEITHVVENCLNKRILLNFKEKI